MRIDLFTNADQKIIYKARSKEKADKYTRMTEFETLIYQYLEEASNKGLVKKLMQLIFRKRFPQKPPLNKERE